MLTGRARCQISSASVRGRKAFQIRCMSWSYRNRGYAARTQRNTRASMVSLIIIFAEAASGNDGSYDVPRNKDAVSAFMNRMLAYSAKKNRANGPPAYSTLKPETSSDSPSARSKGDRFVSARVDTNHMPARGRAGRRSQVVCCAVANTWRENPPAKTITQSKINPRLTS